uniref:Uncharacterized protein n=5 Tax=Aegilops tauschii subsp. strangulata TaxID=200361 RepID=A0A453RYI6_AEGTS
FLSRDYTIDPHASPSMALGLRRSRMEVLMAEGAKDGPQASSRWRRPRGRGSESGSEGMEVNNECSGEERKAALQAVVLGRERCWRRQEQLVSSPRLISWMKAPVPGAPGLENVFLQNFAKGGDRTHLFY